MILEPKTTYDILSGALKGQKTDILLGQKTIRDTMTMYQNASGISDDVIDSLNYRVEVFKVDDIEGGLQFGTSYLYPGTINGEYFMTKGHFHAKSNRTEFYLCLKGEGLLVFMDRNRKWWAEKVYQNSLHYIPGEVAHRLVNTSNEILTVMACWNSDAGHDYATIEEKGFPVRFFNIDSKVIPIKQQ